MRLILILVTLSLLAGCMSAGKSTVEEQKRIQAESITVKRKFNEALALLDSAKYNKAGIAFKKILQEHPTSEFELLIIYNLAGALEGLKKCEMASNRYREVINKSMGRQKKIEAQALIRLSYTYECSGDDAKLIATLLSAQKYNEILPDHIVNAEVPARLAAAYARQGNQTMAQRYFVDAQKGLKVLNSNIRDEEKKKALLAKTLYFMGSIKKHNIDRIQANIYINSLMYLQNYLLLSAEMDNIQWSTKSANEILYAYDALLTYIKTEGGLTTKRSNREQVRNKIKQYEAALLSIYNLKLQRLTDDREPRIIRQLFTQIDERKVKFENELAKLSDGSELTQEALRRQAIKQPGRVLSKKELLHQKTQVKK